MTHIFIQHATQSIKNIVRENLSILDVNELGEFWKPFNELGWKGPVSEDINVKDDEGLNIIEWLAKNHPEKEDLLKKVMVFGADPLKPGAGATAFKRWLDASKFSVDNLSSSDFSKIVANGHEDVIDCLLSTSSTFNTGFDHLFRFIETPSTISVEKEAEFKETQFNIFLKVLKHHKSPPSSKTLAMAIPQLISGLGRAREMSTDEVIDRFEIIFEVLEDKLTKEELKTVNKSLFLPRQGGHSLLATKLLLVNDDVDGVQWLQYHVRDIPEIQINNHALVMAAASTCAAKVMNNLLDQNPGLANKKAYNPELTALEQTVINDEYSIEELSDRNVARTVSPRYLVGWRALDKDVLRERRKETLKTLLQHGASTEMLSRDVTVLENKARDLQKNNLLESTLTADQRQLVDNLRLMRNLARTYSIKAAKEELAAPKPIKVSSRPMGVS